MRLTKNVIALFAMLFIYGTAFSQKTAIGFRTGASYFTINNDLLEENAKYELGLDLAIPVEFQISPIFSIQPELHFSQKGVAFEGMEDGQEQKIAVKTNYLELPVLFKANYGNERFKAYAFVAPSVGYAINRFATEKLGDQDIEKEDIEFVKNGDVQDQRWEFNAMGGIGGSMKAGIGHFVADVRYSFGLSDNTKFKQDKPSDWKKSTNRGCTLSIGYMIPIGK